MSCTLARAFEAGNYGEGGMFVGCMMMVVVTSSVRRSCGRHLHVGAHNRHSRALPGSRGCMIDSRELALCLLYLYIELKMLL